MVSNNELIQNFLRELDFDKSFYTQKMDKMVLNTFSNYTKKLFTDVSKDDVIDFFNAMKTGKIKSRYKRNYAAYSIELYKSQLKKSTKISKLTEEERKERQRERWRNYYKNNKEKYKKWNKNWREKQKLLNNKYKCISCSTDKKPVIITPKIKGDILTCPNCSSNEIEEVK
jgi:hypothetical protein